MKVVLIRHGKAEETSPSGSDAQRVLTAGGKRKLKNITRALRDNCETPITIAVSPLVRAQQTAEILAHKFVDSDVTVRADLEVGAANGELIQWLSEFEDSSTVFCVGHEPSLSLLAANLVGSSTPLFNLGKGGACCLQWEGKLVPGKGQIKWLLTPSQLRDIGD